ncbi:MAG: hypothetical protein HY332_14690 [Chloroflexi bacterium]|nr:hypothetical protein [Chloroflexota bacterium]
METARAGALLRELAELDGTAFSIAHGGVAGVFELGTGERPRVDSDRATLSGKDWRVLVDLRDVNLIALTEDQGRGPRYSVVFADTAGEALLQAHLGAAGARGNGSTGTGSGAAPDAWLAIRDRWGKEPGVRSVTIQRSGGEAEDREVFVQTLSDITEELRESGRINFVLAVGSSVIEAFPPTVFDRLSVEKGYMTLANAGMHVHVNFRRVETLRFCEEHGGVSGHGLPLSLSVKYCAAGGRTLLKAIFPFPHLDDEFKPCELQPERVEFFRRVQERYASRPGVELLVASPSGAPIPAEPITGVLLSA